LIPVERHPHPHRCTHTRCSLRLLSAFIGRSVRIRQCLPSFHSLSPFFFCPLRLFLWVCCGPGFEKKKKKKEDRTLCVVVFGLLLASYFSSLPCLIGISRSRWSSPCGPPPRSRPLQPILSRGMAPRPAIDSDLAILSWANGRLHPRIKRSSRLLSGSACVGTSVRTLSGPRSSRKARERIMCPCTSDVTFFLLNKVIDKKTQLKT
jgi:hypothetical protein